MVRRNMIGSWPFPWSRRGGWSIPSGLCGNAPTASIGSAIIARCGINRCLPHGETTAPSALYSSADRSRTSSAVRRCDCRSPASPETCAIPKRFRPGIKFHQLVIPLAAQNRILRPRPGDGDRNAARYPTVPPMQRLLLLGGTWLRPQDPGPIRSGLASRLRGFHARLAALRLLSQDVIRR